MDTHKSHCSRMNGQVPLDASWFPRGEFHCHSSQSLFLLISVVTSRKVWATGSLSVDAPECAPVPVGHRCDETSSGINGFFHGNIKQHVTEQQIVRAHTLVLVLCTPKNVRGTQALTPTRTREKKISTCTDQMSSGHDRVAAKGKLVLIFGCNVLPDQTPAWTRTKQAPLFSENANSNGWGLPRVSFSYRYFQRPTREILVLSENLSPLLPNDKSPLFFEFQLPRYARQKHGGQLAMESPVEAECLKECTVHPCVHNFCQC